MIRQRMARTGFMIVAGLLLAGPLFLAPTRAQQQPAAPPSPALAAAPSLAAPASPAVPASTTASPSPAAGPPPAATAPAATPSPAPTPSSAPSPNPAPSASPVGPESGEAGESEAMGETIELTPRPAACLEGKADRDEVFGAIMGAIDKIRAEIAKAGLKEAGRPIAVFLEADDSGFKFRAAIPLESAPEGRTALSDAVKLGLTPASKAMRFEHRGAYDDIDATYEAITAYLDERGVDAQDVFIEEYLNDVKTADDPNLQVDIFVLLK